MSFSPYLNVVRLQELKLWQGSYDSLLQKSTSHTRPMDRNSGESVSLDDTSNSSFHSLEKAGSDRREWDKRKISPAKPFEQLLEEKLAEDTPVTVNPKPKKPFLRKGQGLARFRMGAERPANARIRNCGPKKHVLVPPKTTPATHQNTPALDRKGILKKTNPLYHQEVDLSPLKVPDFVKPRGTWKQVFESAEKSFGKGLSHTAGNSEEEQETLENYEEFRKSLGSGEGKVMSAEKKNQDEQLFKTSSCKRVLETDTPTSGSDIENEDKSVSNPNFNSINNEMVEKVGEYAKKYFDGQNALFSNDIPDNLQILTTPEIPKLVGDLTLEELKMARDLKIFETLEKKVGNSSFCSTNTSVVNLLASTPRRGFQNGLVKDKVIAEQETVEDNPSSIDVSLNSVFPKHMQENIQMKIREVCGKTEVLEQFLMNLQKMEHRNVRTRSFSLESDIRTKNMGKNASANTSFSDENTRWSTRSPSPSDNYTHDTIGQSDSWKRVDAAVNTSFDKLDETIKTVETCKECEELRSRYSETKVKLTGVKSETSRLKTELRDLEKEYDKLKRAKKKDEEKYQEKLEDLENELDCERKKMAKEKAFFESYVKDAQNRPSKKEREQITQLKQELADIKELLKLKDTKSGATQARLRTQIKQQEKELSELKITVDKLQKENAKLSASQRYGRRPQEVKMLHEISKNLSKLAEETFKKQLNKSGHGDVEIDSIKETVPTRKKSVDVDGENVDKENSKYGNDISSKDVPKNSLSRTSRDSFRSNATILDVSPSNSLSIEQQYETIFGNFASPRNASASTSIEKNERRLSDGSVEILYSNGNLKKISADGKVIKMKYFNGDTKETDLREQIIRYHYATADSWHIHYSDGREVMEFKDGQKCTKYPDGRTEVSYPDGSLRIINADGTEEQRFPDGRKTLKNLQGEQIILLPNGQREIHTKEYKRREYPDGTIRTLHKDGTVETVYANGRVRLKDANGVLVMDTHQT